MAQRKNAFLVRHCKALHFISNTTHCLVSSTGQGKPQSILNTPVKEKTKKPRKKQSLCAAIQYRGTNQRSMAPKSTSEALTHEAGFKLKPRVRHNNSSPGQAKGRPSHHWPTVSCQIDLLSEPCELSSWEAAPPPAGTWNLTFPFPQHGTPGKF